MPQSNSNNVIPFPNFAIPRSNKKSISKKEAEDNLELTKQYYVQQTLNILTPVIFSHLEIAGFAPDDPDDIFVIKEGAFILEAIRSRMYTHYGLYHPMQRLVDKMFVPDKEEKDLLTIADSISIDFRKK